MASKSNHILTTITCFFVLIQLLFSSCGTECIKFHSPILPYYVYPTNDSIHIGDTIWLEARIPVNMKDFETGETFNFSGVEFNSNFYMYQHTDTSKFLFREDHPQYANRKFFINSTIGKFSEAGNVFKIDYVTTHDSILFKTFIIPKEIGLFSIVLGYNPGGTAHGSQVIKMNDSKCTHKLATLCQSINNGSSTLYRVTEKGFKVWKSPDPTKLENWVYDNRMYFFSVSK
ncbi:MAG: hypothetical protein RL059_283 [Bacteroidota bacterium]|jgi:hypothetical protein